MSAKRKDVGSSPAHDQNFFVQVFSRLGETFFNKNSAKGFSFNFFYVLQQWMLKNAKGRVSSVVWVFREIDTLFVSLIL